MKFSEVFVQEEIKQRLIQSVKEKRISHAQIFAGMEGLHSLALAIAYAQYINCHNRTDTDSCGKCPSCVQFEHLAHPDLHFFFPHPGEKYASPQFYDEWRNLINETHGLFSINDWYNRIGMENKQGIINKADIDIILEKTALKPYESEYKTFIIYMPEKIQTGMANKLLKSLEEPEGKTLFLLVTENYDNILGTIASRCQMIKITRFTTEELSTLIKSHFSCDEETAHKKAVMADHNIITALRPIDDTPEASFSLFQEMMRHAYVLYHPNKYLDFKEIGKWIENMGKMGREQQKNFLQYSLALIRKCMLKNIQLDQMAVSVSEEDSWIEKFKPFIHYKNITQLYSVINETILQIEANANTKILMMDLMLSIGRYLRTADNS